MAVSAAPKIDKVFKEGEGQEWLDKYRGSEADWYLLLEIAELRWQLAVLRQQTQSDPKECKP